MSVCDRVTAIAAGLRNNAEEPHRLCCVCFLLSGFRISPDPSFVTTVPGKPSKLQVLNQNAAFKFLPLQYYACS